MTKPTRPARNKRGWRRRPSLAGDESDAWSTMATVEGPISEYPMKKVGGRAESSGLKGAGAVCKEKREKRPFFKPLMWVREGLETKP